eukprot:m.237427 g.237427  ORF g.237427 m.237427 type:complete len:100 (+) comp17418_c0_seq26:2164-2463(+)
MAPLCPGKKRREVSLAWLSSASALQSVCFGLDADVMEQKLDVSCFHDEARLAWAQNRPHNSNCLTGSGAYISRIPNLFAVMVSLHLPFWRCLLFVSVHL